MVVRLPAVGGQGAGRAPPMVLCARYGSPAAAEHMRVMGLAVLRAQAEAFVLTGRMGVGGATEAVTTAGVRMPGTSSGSPYYPVLVVSAKAAFVQTALMERVEDRTGELCAADFWEGRMMVPAYALSDMLLRTLQMLLRTFM
eukprot:516134-Rhodomonas_salina.3